MKIDVAIIGAGPGGLAAAGALGRTRCHVLVLAGAEQQKRWSHPIHGVLACEGMDRNEYLEKSQQQITSLYKTVRMESDFAETVTAVGTAEAPAFEIEAALGVVHQARRITLATGTIHEVPQDIGGFSSCWPEHIYQCLLYDGLDRADGPHGIGILAQPLSEHHVHLALRAKCFNKNVVIYTNGPDTKEDQLEAEKLFSPLLTNGVTLQHSPISRLKALTGDEAPGIRLYLSYGSEECIAFLVYKMLTRPANVGIATGLGLSTTEVLPYGSFLNRQEPSGGTDVPGVYVCGDAGTLIKGVAPAAAQGLCAADAIWGSLAEEDKSK
jgi:thioredoxin reductase